jgi:SAM-dependent methyltransferase
MERLLEATARAERDHFWFRGFRRFVEPLLVDAARIRPSTQLKGGASTELRTSRVEILDCGCGTGNNLTMLRRYGRATGIDLTWAGLEYAHAAGERRLACATVTRLPFPAETFDVVTSFDVLYALDDEAERNAIAEMFRVLRPGGRLVVNVAALEALHGNHSILSGERRRYSRATLKNHLERAGFSVVRITYTNFTILPLVAGIRLAQRITGHVASDKDLDIPAAPINVALSALLSVEAAALRVANMPIGSSLLAYACKPIESRC